MVDKKLSDFGSVQPSDVSDLVVLYLDENLSPKNGRLSFNSFVSMLALLSGNNAFTGDNTFSGDVVFEGTATFNSGINGTATRAISDASGNNIAGTYATKTELDQKSSFKLFHHDWFDYELNDQSWLRADTFSWQSGAVYTNAYQHLVDDLDGVETEEVTYYAWSRSFLGEKRSYYTKTETPVANSTPVYTKNGVLRAANISSVSSNSITISGNSYTRDSTLDVTGEDFVSGVTTYESNGVKYFRASDGHKIVTTLQSDQIESNYTNNRDTWFYIVDKTNSRFKLPRTKFGFTGLRDSVGKYVEAGLPNIYGTLGESGGNGVWGAFDATGAFSVSSASSQRAGTGSSVTKAITLDASEYNSIYGNSTTVQPPATQMYLYFYVGQFSQSATEQTAGLNSELFNGKADRDLQNTPSNIDFVVENYQNGSDWYRLYRSGYVEQGGSFSSGGSGNKTVTLLVEMADSNYKAKATRISGASTTTNVNVWAREPTSTTQFAIYTSADTGVVWEVKGMSA